jgi:hypothetical protein
MSQSIRSGTDGPLLRPGKDLGDPFRNRSAPVPHFVETFTGNGSNDMSQIVVALVELKFEGIIVLDHPAVEDGHGPNKPTALRVGMR